MLSFSYSNGKISIVCDITKAYVGSALCTKEPTLSSFLGDFEKVFMRLVYRDNRLTPHFTVQWEPAYLAEHPDIWVPFYLIGQRERIGEIHSTTLAVRICEGYIVANRQVVVLGPEMQKN